MMEHSLLAWRSIAAKDPRRNAALQPAPCSLAARLENLEERCRGRVPSQVAEERRQVRPAVISSKTLEALDEYLRFRHVVRNIYAFEFDADRVGRLVRDLDPTFSRVRVELQAFGDFLERLSGSDQETVESREPALADARPNRLRVSSKLGI